MLNQNDYTNAIQSTKGIILFFARDAYLIPQLYDDEEEILTTSLDVVTADNSGKREQFLELLKVMYMIKGICDNHMNDINERGGLNGE